MVKNVNIRPSCLCTKWSLTRWMEACFLQLTVSEISSLSIKKYKKKGFWFLSVVVTAYTKSNMSNFFCHFVECKKLWWFEAYSIVCSHYCTMKSWIEHSWICCQWHKPNTIYNVGAVLDWLSGPLVFNNFFSNLWQE